MRKIFVLIITVFLTSGCATGYMYSSTYDPVTKKSTKVVYSPLFSTNSFPLAEGAEFRMSVVITRRVEPITYSLLTSIGGLGPDDMESTATVEGHFKNDSQKIYHITMNKLRIQNRDYVINASEIVLKPGDRYDTKAMAIKAPTYDVAFVLGLDYELDGKSLSQQFPMKRRSMEEIKKLKRSITDAKIKL